jgi:hypothetical protein
MRKFRAGTFALILGGSTLAIAAGCHGGPATVLAELSESRRLAADLRIQFHKAADASNRAVMAETDEASIAFAHEAEQSSAVVDRDVAALGPLLDSLGVTAEVELLGQFGKQLSSYRKVDRAVLALAVENTNLKAQRLSFGSAREAADRFKAALLDLAPSLSATDRCRAQALAAKATLAVRELQILQGPHIAAADDAAMTSMEKEMATLEAQTTEALTALHGLVAPTAMTTAETAFKQFETIEGQIVGLSRRNTNVRSLELSLKDKPPLTAACDDSLLRLQTALAQEGSKATR